MVFLLLFRGAASSSDHTPSNDRKITEKLIGRYVEGSGRDLILKEYPRNSMEPLRRKNHKETFISVGRLPVQDMNLGRPEYEAGLSPNHSAVAGKLKFYLFSSCLQLRG
jgi:hypothetical protein